MKRFEMIQELTRAIHKLNNRPEIDMNHSYAIAETLLDKAEELGMLPPGWIEVISLSEGNAHNSWEKE